MDYCLFFERFFFSLSVAFSYRSYTLVHFIRLNECVHRNYGFKTSLNNNNFRTNAHRVQSMCQRVHLSTLIQYSHFTLIVCVCMSVPFLTQNSLIHKSSTKIIKSLVCLCIYIVVIISKWTSLHSNTQHSLYIHTHTRTNLCVCELNDLPNLSPYSTRPGYFFLFISFCFVLFYFSTSFF